MTIKEVTNLFHRWVADKDPYFHRFIELGWPEDNDDVAFELTDTEGNKFVVTVTKRD